MQKRFDLNIEEILEDWDVSDGLREIISNAIDEQILTNTKDILIKKNKEINEWIIRDFGRGIHYTHLTQNENNEKTENPDTIGKFGIGLKDALATFHRHEIMVSFRSKFGVYRIGLEKKMDFDEIQTLHVFLDENKKDESFLGTEFLLKGITNKDIIKAKSLFLMFNNEQIIEENRYGEVLERTGDNGKIYINGVKVNQEQNFLFSYNITSLTKKISKALNRERSNVGRQAYSDRIRKILLESSGKVISTFLMNDFNLMGKGYNHDELNWIDIQEHCLKIYNSHHKDTIFFTPSQVEEHPNLVDEVKTSGSNLIKIPERLQLKIKDQKDYLGNRLNDFDTFVEDYQNSYEFNFVDENDLNEDEIAIWNKKEIIMDLIGGRPKNLKEILISKGIMQLNWESGDETQGLWDNTNNRIIIEYNVLKNLGDFVGVLIHECAHAISGASDVTIKFEQVLTEIIGRIGMHVLNRS